MKTTLNKPHQAGVAGCSWFQKITYPDYFLKIANNIPLLRIATIQHDTK